MGISDRKAEDFANHTNCRLGKWYYEGEGRECFSKLSGYREIETPHIKVHRYGIEAIQSFLAGRTDEALGDLSQMEEASMVVLQELDRMAVNGEKDPAILCHANG
jgi:hypothetical protein